MNAPRGFGASRREEYLAHIRSGMLRGAAIEAVGLTRMAVLAWIEANPEFDARVQDAERERLEHVHEALFNAALSGSVPAAKAVLELEGLEMPERRGRPRNPQPETPENPFGDLDSGVISIESRRRSS